MLKVNASIMTSLMFRRMVISLASVSTLALTACNKSSDKTVPVSGVKGAAASQTSQSQTAVCSITTTATNNTASIAYYQITTVPAATAPTTATPADGSSTTPTSTAPTVTVTAINSDAATAAVKAATKAPATKAAAKAQAAQAAANGTTATAVPQCDTTQTAAINAAAATPASGGDSKSADAGSSGTSGDSATGAAAAAAGTGGNTASEKAAAAAKAAGGAPAAAPVAGVDKAAPAAAPTPGAAPVAPVAQAAAGVPEKPVASDSQDGKLVPNDPDLHSAGKNLMSTDYENIIMSGDKLVEGLQDLVKGEPDDNGSNARNALLAKSIYSIESKLAPRADAVVDATGKKLGTQQADEVTITMRDLKDSNQPGEKLVFTGALENKGRTIVLKNEQHQDQSVTYVCADKSENFCEVGVLRYDKNNASEVTHIYAVLRKTDRNAVEWFNSTDKDAVASTDTTTVSFRKSIDEFITGQSTDAHAVQFFILETTEIVNGRTHLQATFATKDAEVFSLFGPYVAKQNFESKDAAKAKSVRLDGPLMPLGAKLDNNILMDWEVRNNLTEASLKYDMQQEIKSGEVYAAPGYKNMLLMFKLNGATVNPGFADPGIRLRITRSQPGIESLDDIKKQLSPDPAPGQ